MRHDVFATSLWSRSTNIDEVDLLEILLWDFVWPVENIPSSSGGGRSQVKPATQVQAYQYSTMFLEHTE